MCAALLALFLPSLLPAEVLSPPPIPLDPWAGRGEVSSAPSSDAPTRGTMIGRAAVFSEVYGWMGLERYQFETGRPLFAWDFDLGAHVLFVDHPAVAVSGLARLLYQNQSVGDIRFSIDPSAIVTDLHLRARFPNVLFEPTVWYRHDCKHDIARQRRDPIHDAIGVNGRYRFETEVGGGLLLSVDTLLTLEYQLPLVFQDYEASPDVASGYLSIRQALEMRHLTVFIEARGALLIDDPESELATSGAYRTDGLVRLGVSWPDNAQGATLYAQAEYISDPWRLAVDESEPAAVYSVGLIFAGR